MWLSSDLILIEENQLFPEQTANLVNELEAHFNLCCVQQTKTEKTNDSVMKRATKMIPGQGVLMVMLIIILSTNFYHLS